MRLPAPVWMWTLSVLAIYPAWHVRRPGDPLAVPAALVVIEFGVPLAAAALFLMKGWPYRRAAGIAHG
jgi:hypothetical protein